MSNTDEDRWHQRLESLERAMTQLLEACELEEYSDLERAGLVQMFEFCFELSWNTVKDLLSVESVEIRGARDAIREGHKYGLIDDVDAWFEALANRNLLTHVYDEELAENGKNLIREKYAPMLRDLLSKLRIRRNEA